MRDHMIAMLLSVLLGGLSLPDVDALDDTQGRDAVPHRTLAGGFASLDIASEEVVVDDDRGRISRTRLTPLPLVVSPPIDDDAASSTTPVIWSSANRGKAGLAAGLWPIDADTAQLALARTGDAMPTHDDAAALLGPVLEHCRERGYLKLVLHTPVELAELLTLIEREGFLFNRHRDHHGTAVVEFYRNLYWQPHHDDEVA